MSLGDILPPPSVRSVRSLEGPASKLEGEKHSRMYGLLSGLCAGVAPKQTRQHHQGSPSDLRILSRPTAHDVQRTLRPRLGHPADGTTAPRTLQHLLVGPWVQACDSPFRSPSSLECYACTTHGPRRPAPITGRACAAPPRRGMCPLCDGNGRAGRVGCCLAGVWGGSTAHTCLRC